MGKTSIAWTETSWNPFVAYNRETGKRGWFCVKVSEGCTNCYASRRNRLERPQRKRGAHSQ